MADTWLPHEPPPPPPAPKSKARRTIFLWLSLIVMFTLIYSFFDPQKGAHPAAPPHDSAPSTWWVWILVVAAAMIPTAVFLWYLSTARNFNAQQAPALEALADGQYTRAAQLFGDLARRLRTKPNASLAAAYNQGYALIRAGDAAKAIGVLLGVERWPSLGLDGIRGIVALELARAFAIGGDVDKAKHWLDAARSRATFADPGHAYAHLAAIEALVLCRAGRFEDADRHYEASWERLQSRLTLREMRDVWLLRAFAVSKTTGPRDSAAAETWLRLLRATQPTSPAWLTAQWPELASFAAHELGAPARVAATRAT